MPFKKFRNPGITEASTLMKTRKEASGTHLFDRVSGLHILLDEVKVPTGNCSIAPRTVSIALTNICDLKCSFCYAPKTLDSIPYDFVRTLMKKLDELGSLEITIGGGEPLLYPYFSELCNWVWDNTYLGVSVTTHGHHLSERIISEIEGKVSSMRFSIDGVEPYYSEVRGKPLQKLLDIIRNVRGKIPFGINTVVSPNKISELTDLIKLGIAMESQNILIIPEHANGVFKLSKSEWRELNEIIDDWKSKIQLYLVSEAYDYLVVDCLQTEIDNEFLFAHISADGKLKVNSFCEEGIRIEDINKLEEYFKILRNL